jgi:hypothetical protein
MMLYLFWDRLPAFHLVIEQSGICNDYHTPAPFVSLFLFLPGGAA